MYKKVSEETVALPRPANGSVYTDDEALRIIKQYPKGSEERATMRNLMVSCGYVSSRSTFCRRVKEIEDQEAHHEPGMRTEETREHVTKMTKQRHMYHGEYIRKEIRHQVTWKGRIILRVTPIYLNSSEYEIRRCLDRGNWNIQPIDICVIIGNCDAVERLLDHERRDATSWEWPHIPEWKFNFGQYIYKAQDPKQYLPSSDFAQLCEKKNIHPLKFKKEGCGNRISRLYFDTHRFPPPGGMRQESSDHIVMGKLRNYIKKSAEICGSPVVCMGKSGKRETRFRCKYWYRRKSKPKEGETHPYNQYSCTFSFGVRWDEFGYYIPVYKNKLDIHSLGCGWHCCEEQSNHENQSK